MHCQGGEPVDWLRDAVVNHKARALSRQWQDAGAALMQLLQDEQALAAIPPAAAWAIVNALQNGLRDVEAAVRQARRHELPAGARRATGDLLYALGGVRDVLERYIVPEAERRYGLPPRDDTR